MTISDKMSKNSNIAIVGIACRFPDAGDYEQFWMNIRNGVDSVKNLNEKRWNTKKYNKGVFTSSDSGTCCYDGLLDQIDQFDYSFFNISPREAKYMDPQHRLLLEEAVHCMEDSGIPVSELQEKTTSVYVGLTGNDYDLFTLTQGEDVDNYASLGSFHCMASNRISHFLGLSGVSLTLDTACSSSLVSIHMAKQSLLTKESDYAFAGGVCLAYHPWRYMSFSKSHMMSPDGSCKAFDEDANGFVQGEGVGVLLLQRLEDAVRDHNHIYGVIKGSAVNHCGDSLTIAAPKMEAQKDVIMMAAAEAGIPFENISYVETHGTGTSIGDPIEVGALIKAFRTDTSKEHFCDLGSVKTNIGHLGSAAGVAGIIKVLMMMKYRQIPRLLHQKKRNGIMNFLHSPFTISEENKTWEPENHLLCAGVSGFGFGGVNAHVILEEWKVEEEKKQEREQSPTLFALSAKSRDSLLDLVHKWQDFLPQCSESIEDICATLLTGRSPYDYRMGVVIGSREELEKVLSQDITISHKQQNQQSVLFFGTKEVNSKAEAKKLPGFKEAEQIIEEFGYDKNDLPAELNKLIYQYAVGKFLLQVLQQKPKCLRFEGDGIWACMVLGGMMTLKQTIQFLKEGRKETLTLNRPLLPVYDPTQNCLQEIVRFDVNYFLELQKHSEITAEEESYYIEKGRGLYRKQRTFMKFFNDWCKAAAEYQMDLGTMLYSEIPDEKTRVLLVTAIICSIERLNAKWNLENEYGIVSEAYSELLDLCFDRVMSEADFVGILLGDEEKRASIIGNLSAGRMNFDRENKYQNIRFESIAFKTGEDASSWIEESRKQPYTGMDGVRVVGCGCEKQDAEYTLFASGELKEEILSLWLAGADIDLRFLFEEKGFTKVALPTYAFQGEECWVPEEKGAGLHPMIDCNVSTVQEFLVKKTISAADFYVRDHVVDGKVIVPGVFYLEMARAAGAIATGENVVELSNVMWTQTCVLDRKEKDLFAAVSSKQKGYEFKIFSIANQKRIVHAQGRLLTVAQSDRKPARQFDISAIAAGCDYSVNHKTCYQMVFSDYIGFDYGPGFQVTDMACGNEKEGLESLNLPRFLRESLTDYVLHPSILDAALRAITWVGGKNAYKQKVLHIPFALGRIEILGELPEKTYSYARLSDDSVGKDAGTKRYDLSVLDEQGNELIRVHDFTIRGLKDTENEKRKSNIKYFKKTLQKSAGTIRENGNIVFVEIGEKPREKDRRHFAVQYGSCEQILSLCERLKAQENKVSQLVCLFRKEENADGVIEEYRENKDALVSLLYFVQAMKKTGLEVGSITVLTHSVKEPGIRSEMITGFFKSVKSILHNTVLRVAEADEDSFERMLREEPEYENEKGVEEIFYIGGKRFASSFEPMHGENSGASKLKNQGRYLITGALGGIGREISAYLAEHYGARLILVGRSAAAQQTEEWLAKLRTFGGQAEYLSSDITDIEAVNALYRKIDAEYGGLDGIIHCAGMTDKCFVMDAREEDYDKVLRAKMLGALNIDRVFRESRLDFFLLMSSISSIIGDYQRGSYGAANGFLNSFAGYRNYLAEKKERYGRTYSAVWPIWLNGSMKPEGKEKEAYYGYLGMEDLTSEDAMRALEEVLKEEEERVVIIAGSDRCLEDSCKNGKARQMAAGSSMDAKTVIVPQRASACETVVRWLKEVIAETIGLNPDKMKSSESFDHYGIDSIMIAELNKKLNEKFSDIPATLFFEYNNIDELAQYFLEHGAEEICETKEENKENENAEKSLSVYEERVAEDTSVESSACELVDDYEDIAIIGIDGKYPKADNLDEFWKHISLGEDCITEVPKERWEHSRYFDKEKGKKNKVYCKWGGFLNSVDEFDPLFFNITPKEAMVIDPQERLFLECAYHTIEDAGYTRESLGTDDIGVFVGVMNGHYQLYGAEELEKGHVIDVRSTYASIANRVSYFFNFHGPSMAIDTMCSSSLASIHLACRSIRNGECEMAIAGGVNVIIHPAKYVFLSEQKFGSSEGKCRAFGNGGDGYVPAEGVGAFLLKPLKKAVRDCDHIYGVIRGSGMNHDGRTNGYTVPNPNAQAALIARVLDKASVNPENITYLEAHGTGTQLGDPIEIAGLTKAYQNNTMKTGYCYIGSVKDCIGHAESAAGVASITKVLLQMQHGKIAPSVYGGDVNEHIDFSRTPFKLTTELIDWEKPKAYGKRMAGVSSFGAGGSNVHILIEEYGEQAKTENRHQKKKWLFPLSASAKSVLMEYAAKYSKYLDQLCTESCLCGGEKYDEIQTEITEQLSKYLCVEPDQIPAEESFYNLDLTAYDFEYLFAWIRRIYGVELSVGDIVECSTVGKLAAYVNRQRGGEHEFRPNDDNYGICVEQFVRNLFEGRERMEYRLGILFTSVRDLHFKLKAFAATGAADGIQIFVTDKNADSKDLPVFEEIQSDYFTERRMERIARCWVEDGDLEWSRLYEGEPLEKMQGLPTYPFRKEHLWLEQWEVERMPLPEQNSKNQEMRICEKICLNSSDSVLRDHYISGQYILAGVAQVKYVIEVLRKYLSGERVILQNVYWLRPLAVKGEKEILISMSGEEKIDFEVKDLDGIVYSRGTIQIDNGRMTEERNFTIENDGAEMAVYSSEEVYREFEQQDIFYGPLFRGIERMQVGDRYAVTWITGKSDEKMELAVFDGILQSLSGFTHGLDKTYVPYMIGKAILKLPLGGTVRAELMKKDGNLYDILVYTVSNELCAEFKDVCIKLLPGEKHSMEYFFPIWKIVEEEKTAAGPGEFERSCLIAFGEESEWTAVKLGEFIEGIGGKCRKTRIGSSISSSISALNDLKEFDEIYYLDWAQEASRDVEERIVPFFRFCKALIEAGCDERKLTLKLITNCAYSVENEEENHAYGAALIGFANTLRQEIPLWNICCMDVRKDEIERESVFIPLLYTEQAGRIALRSGKRYECVWRKYVPEATSKRNYVVGGTYMILGGAGGIGFTLCEYLVKNYDARVVLVGRKKLEELSEKVQSGLERFSGRAYYYSSDICNVLSLSGAVKYVRERFGHINGVIHSAANMHDSAVRNMKEEDLIRVVKPKVDGLTAMEEVFAAEKPDLVILFSSMQSMKENPGQANYAMANEYMDAYAASLQRNLGARVSVINWGYWDSVGIAGDLKYKEPLVKRGIYAIRAQEGMEALEKVLSGRKLQMSAIKIDHSRFQIEALEDRFEAKVEQKKEMRSVQKKATGKVMDVIKETINEVLAIREEDIDITKQFSDYGVDSIIGVSMVSEINQKLNLQLKTTVLFDYVNVEKLAAYIEELVGEEPIQEEPEETESEEELRILRDLARGEISAEEVLKRYT